MDAHDILAEMLHTYGVNYGGRLDEKEATAFRAALTPWIEWMKRPVFNPRRNDQLDSYDESDPVYQVYRHAVSELTDGEFAGFQAYLYDCATPRQRVDAFDKWMMTTRHGRHLASSS